MCTIVGISYSVCACEVSRGGGGDGMQQVSNLIRMDGLETARGEEIRRSTSAC